MKFMLAIAALLISVCGYAQETYSSVKFQGLLDNAHVKVLRTDMDGNVVWEREIQDLTESYDEEVVIIAFQTHVKGGKIVGNPSDYDYWLIGEEDMDGDFVDVFPTLSTGTSTIYLSTFSNKEIYCDLYDVNGKHLKMRKLRNGSNDIYFYDLPDGSYYLRIYINNEFKTYKINVQK
jgi:hypothetical protein